MCVRILFHVIDAAASYNTNDPVGAAADVTDDMCVVTCDGDTTTQQQQQQQHYTRHPFKPHQHNPQQIPDA